MGFPNSNKCISPSMHFDFSFILQAWCSKDCEKWINNWDNESISQSVNQSVNQSINQSVIRSIDLLTNQRKFISQLVNRQVSQSVLNSDLSWGSPFSQRIHVIITWRSVEHPVLSGETKPIRKAIIYLTINPPLRVNWTFMDNVDSQRHTPQSRI